MSDKPQKLSPQDVEAEDLADWRILFSTLHARFRTGDFATGLRLVNLIGEEAESMNHHPDLDLSYPLLNVRLMSHDAGGVTDRDITLARKITQFAADLGVTADPAAVSVLELALDTWDHTAIKPFWKAVLAMSDSSAYDEEIVDPGGALPTLWFQKTDEHDEPRQRFHLDIRVPPEVAEDRIAAALAAGGTLVSEEHAPTFTVLADAQGNKVCVCTCVGRSG
jgi:4a-hydroxytetrahydrobiopterin dehydratase